jgi:DNA-3-methyladenine glycosylase
VLKIQIKNSSIFGLMSKLNLTFYLNADVVDVSKKLLGKKLCTFIDGQYTAGIITETEAYAGIIDKASHAYNNRNTKRTQTMYLQGGVCYVYLCYGIHHLFNVVTNVGGIPHAVLIRAIKPTDGIETMLARRNKTKLDKTLTSGPGAMSQALGINTAHNGISLLEQSIWIEDFGINVKENEMIKTTRIGVDYAKEHALWPYRFYIKDEMWVSRK